MPALNIQQAVATYLNGGSWTLVGEFTEIESGRNADRPKLQEALAIVGHTGPRWWSPTSRA
jgi:hypothetical protein